MRAGEVSGMRMGRTLLAVFGAGLLLAGADRAFGAPCETAPPACERVAEILGYELVDPTFNFEGPEWVLYA